MFEYCLYRRDEWIDECEEAAGDIELPKEEPGWDDVYDYGYMHYDLLRDGCEGCDFRSEVCRFYNDFIERNAAAIAANFGGDGELDDDYWA